VVEQQDVIRVVGVVVAGIGTLVAAPTGRSHIAERTKSPGAWWWQGFGACSRG
jgi:hypothetical protein